MDSITDNLHLTRATSLLDLPEDHKFDEIVSLSYRDHLGTNFPEQSTTGNKFVFPDGPHEYEVFESAVDYTIDCLDNGDNTLVHCQAGVSRSAGVCIAALATIQDIDVQDARQKVEDARSVINPTPEIWDSTKRYVRETNREDPE